MTDFANVANLTVKVDSTEAGHAARDLDKLTVAGKRTEAAIDRLGDSSVETAGQMRGAGRAASDYAAAAQTAAARTTNVGEAGKFSKHHIQNLAFQFNDLGIQMAMAAQSSAPLRMSLMALAQQGSQIAAVMGQAGVGVGGLAKQMASGTASFIAAHPAIAAVVAVAGVAAAAFGLMTGEINKNAKTQVEWSDVALGAWDAARAFLKDKLTAGFEYFGTTAEGVWKAVVNAAKWAINFIIGGMTLVPRVAIAAFSTIGPAIGDAFYSGVNLAIRGLNFLIKKTVDGVNVVIGLLNKVAGVQPGGSQLPTLSAPQIDEVSNQYAGAGRKFASAMGDAFTDTWNRDYIGEAAEYLSPFAQKRARERLAKDGEKAGAGAGKAAGKAAADAFADEFNKEFEKFAQDNWNDFIKSFGEMRKTWAASDAADIRDVQDEMARAQDERIKGAREEAEAQSKLRDELVGLIGALDQLGGFGSTLADLGAAFYGSKTGDYSGVSGAPGFLAQQLFSVQWNTTDKNGERVTRTLGDVFDKVLTKVFGDNGSFTNLLKSAGIGAAVGQTLFGNKNKGAQIGGAIGGALGKISGIPGADVIGSLIGSVIGGVLNKRPRGAGSVSGSSVSASANDAAIKEGLDSFGLGVQQGVASIAQQLGGTVGAYSIGIGRYKDYFQVSSSANDPALGGTYFNKKSSNALYDGTDAAAAMRAAILGAIEQGAIQGIREGSQRLLKAGTDIEAQVAKAIKFQGVFDELKQATDPMGAALEQLTRQFDELRTIFGEAGASAEEYAQLEQLLAIKRKEAQDGARKAMVDKVRDPIEMQIRLLELLGREEDALAASRLLELAGIKAALQPMQAMIYQLEDARKVIDTFEPLAADLKAFRDELLGGGGDKSFGYVAAQFRAIADAAAGGDATAMGKLRGAASSYLDAARLNAGSDLEYRRALGTVLSGVDRGIFAADTQIDYAQAQIDAVNNSTAVMEQMRADLTTLQTQVVENTGIVARMWQRFEVNGLPVITNQDEPLQVEVVA